MRVVILFMIVIAGGCLAVPKWSPPESAVHIEMPHPADQALDAAADCFAQGNDAAAIPHLSRYLEHLPDAHTTRLQLAELLLREGRGDEAEREFERVLVEAPATSPVHARRAQCHARLATLAGARGDTFTEELHRGMGLVRLVEKWDAQSADDDSEMAEPALTQALAAFQSALDHHPEDARAHLYQALAFKRLGQEAAAERSLILARAGLPDPALSVAERERILADDVISARRIP